MLNKGILFKNVHTENPPVQDICELGNRYFLTGKPFSPGSPLGPAAPCREMTKETIFEPLMKAVQQFASAERVSCCWSALLLSIVYSNITTNDMC